MLIPKNEPVLTTISMGTDVGQSEFSNVSPAPGQANLKSEAPAQAPQRKRGRPRKNKDLNNVTTRFDLPSGGAPLPLSSRPPEECSAYESTPAASTYGSPGSDSELALFDTCSPTSGLPAVHPDPYSKDSDSPVKNQQDTESPAVKRRRGRPPKNQPLDKNSSDSNVSGKKLQQDGKNPDGIRSRSTCDRDKDTTRPRGRPKGSGKIKTEASESPSGNMHEAAAIASQVLHINPGEDVTRAVTSFCKKALRPMCVLSASGAVGYVELKHEFPSSDGSTIYQGIREILCMSGYFIAIEGAEDRSWSSRLSVALADSGGAVIGGCVSGALIAASKLHVVLGSFTCRETHTSQDSV